MFFVYKLRYNYFNNCNAVNYLIDSYIRLNEYKKNSRRVDFVPFYFFNTFQVYYDYN